MRGVDMGRQYRAASSELDTPTQSAGPSAVFPCEVLKKAAVVMGVSRRAACTLKREQSQWEPMEDHREC